MVRVLVISISLVGCTTSMSTQTPTTTSTPTTTGTGTNTGTATSTSTSTSATPGSSPRRVLGYFPAWGVYGRDYHVPDVPADKLTHLIYAFANIENGRCVLGDPYADIDRFYDGDSWDPGSLRGSFHQLELLKQDHPQLRTILSVGGWTWSSGFSNAASDESSREAFAASCIDLVRTYGFDGLSVDWEYPVSGGLVPGQAADTQNYTLLMAEIRSELDAYEATDGKNYELSIAASASPIVAANMEVAALAGILDWLDLMTYDFRGSWSARTGLQAPLYPHPGDPEPDAPELNVDAAVDLYLAAGVAADQLVVGVPFYGRGWAGVPADNDGLFQPYSSIPYGTWEPAAFDYSDIAANWERPDTVFWDDDAKAAWIYDAAEGVMITYDNPESVEEKAAYVIDRGLGGIMFWELSADSAADDLLDAVHAGYARTGGN